MCVNAAVVLPNFVTNARPTVVTPMHLVDCFLITCSLNFVDDNTVAGTVNEEDAKPSHVTIGPESRRTTLIWINRQNSSARSPILLPQTKRQHNGHARSETTVFYAHLDADRMRRTVKECVLADTLN